MIDGRSHPWVGSGGLKLNPPGLGLSHTHTYTHTTSCIVNPQSLDLFFEIRTKMTKNTILDPKFTSSTINFICVLSTRFNFFMVLSDKIKNSLRRRIRDSLQTPKNVSNRESGSSYTHFGGVVFTHYTYTVLLTYKNQFF